MAEPIDNMRHKLEDEAFLMFGDDCQSLYLSSIAISLKRIADRLDALGSGEDMDPRLHNTITNLAWEAGRSFQAGTRTDR